MSEELTCDKCEGLGYIAHDCGEDICVCEDSDDKVCPGCGGCGMAPTGEPK